MRLGLHVSTQGGLGNAIDRAQLMGAETIQIFGSAPQMWRRRTIPEAETLTFRENAEAAGVEPIFLHATYLVNLATTTPEHLEKGVAALVADLELCAATGAKGSIFHVGSHRGAGLDSVLAQVVASTRRVLDSTPAVTWLILENSAGMGGSIGARFEELGRIMKEVGDARVKVCLDTQHAFAMGYDVATASGLEKTLAEFDREIGLSNLVAVHANDSKVALGGIRDRHENIGEGHIGREGFRVMMSHPAFHELPFLLEIPGFNNQGPDKENLDILKSIREEALGVPS